MLKTLIKQLFTRALIVSTFSLGLALSAPLSAFAFLGMNAGATLQGPLPAWTKQFGSFQTAKAATYGQAVATDTSGNILVAGYTVAGVDGNARIGLQDSFVTKYDSSGTKLWTRQLGVASHTTNANGVATDSSGNIVVAGNTNGGVDGNTLTGSQDFFVTKYDSSGTKLWTRQLGVSSKATSGNGVVTDSSGNIFVAGSTTGGLDGNTLTGSQDFFVTKYDSTGTKVWTRQLGVTSQYTYGNGVVTDSSGNIFVAGSTTGGLDGNTSAGAEDIFVTKYDSTGTKVWTKQLGATTVATYGNAVAIDSSGNIFIVGYTYGGLDGNSMTGNPDAFVTKYNSAGTKQWTRQFGAASAMTIAYGAAADSSGNVYVAGSTLGGVDGNTLTGTQDFFVIKYNSSGTKQWTKQLGVAAVATQGRGTATDPSGNIFVAGYTPGNLDNVTLTGTQDSFVTKYDTTGARQWTQLVGGLGGTTLSNISSAADTSGNLYVAGTTDGGINGYTLTGTTDFFITKYNSSGTKLWTRLMGVAAKTTSGYGVATDSSGNIFVAGSTTGGLDGKTLTGTQDFFVIKYDSSGTEAWSRLLGATGSSTTAYGVTTDASGNVYVAGDTTGSLDGNTLTGTKDFFVTKYDSSGTKLWTRQLGVSSQATSGRSVATDSSGNIFVAGSTTGGLDGNTLTGTTDFFVTKYDSSGAKLWTKQLGTASKGAFASGVASDPSGNVFVAGSTTGGLDGNTLTGLQGLFVTKYDSSGSKQWTRVMGTSGGAPPTLFAYGYGIAADSFGNVFAVGSVSGQVFDGIKKTGSNDFYVVKYDSAGVRRWTKLLGALSQSTRAYSVAIDPLGHLYVAGTTSGGLDFNILNGTVDAFACQYIGN